MIKGQITELLTNYGEIPFLIVDGWNAPWGGPSYEMLPFEELDSLVKSLQPDCLFMNIGCSKGLEGTDIVFYENEYSSFLNRICIYLWQSHLFSQLFGSSVKGCGITTFSPIFLNSCAKFVSIFPFGFGEILSIKLIFFGK